VELARQQLNELTQRLANERASQLEAVVVWALRRQLANLANKVKTGLPQRLEAAESAKQQLYELTQRVREDESAVTSAANQDENAKTLLKKMSLTLVNAKKSQLLAELAVRTEVAFRDVSYQMIPVEWAATDAASQQRSAVTRLDKSAELEAVDWLDKAADWLDKSAELEAADWLDKDVRTVVSQKMRHRTELFEALAARELARQRVEDAVVVVMSMAP
jgi:hypothetical protein